MRKKVLVRGPVLSQSGYGEHTRFVLRALRKQEHLLDIHVLPTKWGETGWLSIDDDEREWIDTKVNESIPHLHNKIPYDLSVQVTIPNEWENIASVNIGVTAGIETNKVCPLWIQKANLMDKIITISQHSKSGFNTSYTGQNSQTGEMMKLECITPIEISSYPVKKYDNLTPVDLGLDYDFNYLAMAQWGPRKNLHNIIKWFVEENHDQEVGLVIKTSLKNNSIVDRTFAMQQIVSSIPDIPDRKCKIYLLHGDMTQEEIHSLYKNPKIKVMVSATHGEGFGLPLFEAAYSGLPVIAPGWSGQVDFLYMPNDSKSKKKKMKAMFADVDFTLGPVEDNAVWENVIHKDMVWCYPHEGSFKLRLRQVRKNYNKYLEKAKKLQDWVISEFESDKMHDKLSDLLHSSAAVKEMEDEIQSLLEDLL